MTCADASTMTNDDQRLADILTLLSSIDERLPKRRVKSTAIPIKEEPDADPAPAEKPKRVRKPSAKAAAATSPLEPDLDAAEPPPAKPARKPRAKKAAATADSHSAC
jgi:hypothetical protein